MEFLKNFGSAKKKSKTDSNTANTANTQPHAFLASNQTTPPAQTFGQIFTPWASPQLHGGHLFGMSAPPNAATIPGQGGGTQGPFGNLFGGGGSNPPTPNFGFGGLAAGNNLMGGTAWGVMAGGGTPAAGGGGTAAGSASGVGNQQNKSKAPLLRLLDDDSQMKWVTEHEAKLDEKDKAFKAALIGCVAPITMLYAGGTEKPVLRMIHSPTTCAGPSVKETPAYGKMVGFKVHNNAPMFVGAGPWKLKEVCVPEGVELLGDGKTVAAITDPKLEQLPGWKLCPAKLVPFLRACVEKDEGLLQCCLAVHTTYPNEFEEEKKWLRAASLLQSDGKKSQLAVTMSAADVEARAFSDWCQFVLTAYGVADTPSPTSTTPVQQAPAASAPTPQNAPTQLDPTIARLFDQQSQLQAGLLLGHQQSMSLAYQMHLQSANGGGGAHRGSNSKINLSDEKWAEIASLSHIDNAHDLGGWWLDIQGNTKDDCRNFWKKSVDRQSEWARSRNLYYDDQARPDMDMVWDLMQANFHADSTDYEIVANKGLTPFLVRQMSDAEVEKRDQDKAAITESAATRTHAESLAISKKNSKLPNPPATYTTLKSLLIRHTGLVWDMFTENSPLYTQLMEVINVLSGDDASRNQHQYEGVPARQIFWLVLVETKKYLRQRCSLDEMADRVNPPRLPDAELLYYKVYIKEAQPLPLRNFPPSWMQPAPSPPTLPPHPSLHLPPQGSVWGGWPQLPQGENPFLQQQLQLQLQQEKDQQQPPPTSRKLPARVAAAWDKALAVDPKLRLAQICEKGGTRINELPKAPDGKSYCFNYLTGKCRFGKRCSFNHTTMAKLPTKVIDAWTETMERGAEAIVNEDTNSTSPDKRKRE